MGNVLFYHLTERPLEATLPTLLEKSLQKGWRVAVRGTDDARLDWLDQKLWLGPQEGFLPHGRAGGPHDTEQPVLLTTGEAANGAACLMSIDGANISAEEARRFERVCILFDGNEPAAVAHAREQWKDLTAAGLSAEYWAQAQGRWVRKATSGAADAVS